jgi:hypothetical protein
MTKMKFFIAVLAGLLFINTANAQEEESPARNSFTFANDLVSWAFGGYDFELGYNFGKNRVALTFNGLEVPDFYSSDEDYTVDYHYFGATYSRFINDYQKGFNYGVSFGYVYTENVERDNSDDEEEHDYWKAGVRLGYYWMPFASQVTAIKGVYIEPAINVGMSFNEGALALDKSTSYDGSSDLKIFGPMLHVGYKF